MTRWVVAVVAGVAAVSSGTATASPAPAAACAAILTSYEATELPPGFVGAEVSALAGPGFGGVVSTLAGSHLGTLEACAALAP